MTKLVALLLLGALTTFVQAQDHKVICYFSNWAWYRPGIGQYGPDHIPNNLCTHINYAFSSLDPGQLIMKPNDTWLDLDNQFYKRVTDMKQFGMKIMISIGGWHDSNDDRYSRMVNDPWLRSNFIANAVTFLQTYNFDGLDLDWEYPKCWQNDCSRGPASDRDNFINLIRELRDAFAPYGYQLSAAVSASKLTIDEAYNVYELSQYLDWINLMTYDYHGSWDSKTGHVAPLYWYPGDDADFMNVDYTVNYFIQLGADPRKLNLGLPFYAVTFTLLDPANNGLHAPATPGIQGEFTNANGSLSFYEACSKIKTEFWTVVRDGEGRIGPYAYGGNNQWAAYDDIAEITRKSNYLKSKGLGGALVWAMDTDDFAGICGCGTYPLLRRLAFELRGVPLESFIENCT